MRFIALAMLTMPWVVTPAAGAGLNRNYMVPAYKACETGTNCNPPVLASAYTFDSIVLYSSPQRYTGPGKLALMLVVKGLKDPSGAPFTGTVEVNTGSSRVTLLTQGVGTLADDSPLATQPPYRVDVKNGDGRQKFVTPDSTPEHGLVVNTLGAPVVYDPDGNPLATTGTQAKP